MEDTFNWQILFTGLFGVLLGLILPVLFEKWRPTIIRGKVLGIKIQRGLNLKFPNELSKEPEVKLKGTGFRFKIAYNVNKNIAVKDVKIKINIKGKWHDGVIYYIKDEHNIPPEKLLQFDNQLNNQQTYIRYVNFIIPDFNFEETSELEFHEINVTFLKYSGKVRNLIIKSTDYNHLIVIPED